jgi:PAS domain S-box-containing protein
VSGFQPVVPGNREFEALFTAAPDAVALVDDHRTLVEVNPAACRLLGLPRAELIGQPIDAFLELSAADMDVAWHAFLSTTEFTGGDVRVRRRDGVVRDVEYRATTHVLAGLHLAVLRDVTERKQAEAERAELLRREQARLRETETLLAVSRALSATLDPTETMRRVAREIALALGADMVGAYLANRSGDKLRPIAGYHVPRRLLERFRQCPIPITQHPAIEEAWAHKRSVWTDDMNADPRVDRASYERFPHQSDVFVPIRVKDRPVGGFFVIWWTARRSFERDELRILEGISDLAGIFLENAQLYQQAADANRAKDEFLATLSHELRNPVGSISNAAHALGRPGVSDELALRLREIIARQARHLGRLLADLLDVARLTAGKIALQREPVDLRAAAQRCIASTREREGPLTHRITLTGEPVLANVDPTRLDQIVTNLLDNAVTYTPPGGRIEVGVERDGDDAVLRVADSGIGIAPEMLTTIFDLFSQARPPGQPSGGLGIGLTIVRRLVEMHGGRITAVSEGAGRGSEFIVRLPLAASGTPTTSPPPDPVDAGARRVVVIEDNDDARESLRALLESLGHRVVDAADGGRGVALALEQRPDVVLVDLGLPILDGCEVARALRETPEGKRMRLIAVTGYGQPEDRERSRAAGFDAHLVKPVTVEALSSVLHRRR